MGEPQNEVGSGIRSGGAGRLEKEKGEMEEEGDVGRRVMTADRDDRRSVPPEKEN